MGKSAKGGNYEREIARQLSVWWSGGRRDDVFWRIPGSGGRATRRGQKGHRTSGQYGDLEATHPKGKTFLRMFTPELKRGYSKFTPFDMIDLSPNMACQVFEAWVIQAMEAAEYAKSRTWMVIFRRDFRQHVVTFPRRVLTMFARVDAGAAHNLLAITPSMSFSVRVRRTKQITETHDLFTVPLADFMRAVSPADIIKVLEFRP